LGIVRVLATIKRATLAVALFFERADIAAVYAADTSGGTHKYQRLNSLGNDYVDATSSAFGESASTALLGVPDLGEPASRACPRTPSSHYER
jgi:hypothetical protein